MSPHRDEKADAARRNWIGNDDCRRQNMRRRCTITRMSERRVREIACRCWPQLHAGRFVPAGRLAQPDSRTALDQLMPGESSPELEERDRGDPAAQRSMRIVPFADRRALRPRAEVGMRGHDEGPFDDAA